MAESRDNRGPVFFFVPTGQEHKGKPGELGIPLEALATAHATEKAGFSTRFLDESATPNFDEDLSSELAQALKRALVACLWLGEIYPYQLRGVVRFLEFHRKVGASCPLVFGGQLVTICPENILNNCQGIDLFIHGVGEQVLPILCQRLASGESLTSSPGIPGTATPGPERLIVHPDPPPTSLPDSYSTFYRSYDLTQYVQRGPNIFGNRQPMLPVRLGRGCAKACRFCYHYRIRSSRVSAAQAVEDILYLRERYGVDQFHFHELDFFSDKDRSLEIADRLSLHNDRLKWFALGSVVDLVTYEPKELDLLRTGGCTHIEMGTESGSSTILSRIGKRHHPEDAFTATELLLQHGFYSIQNLLFGVPGETHEDRVETLRLARRILKIAERRVLFHPRLYQLSPGTPFGDQVMAEQEDVPFPTTMEEAIEYRATWHSSRVFPWFEAREEQEAKNLANYLVPMLEARGENGGWWDRLMLSGLRGVADLRVRSGYLGLPLDRWVYRKLLGHRVSLVNSFSE